MAFTLRCILDLFFFVLFGKFSSLNYMGGSPSTNGRLQGYIPGIMKCQKFWVGAEKARLFIGRNCTCRGCFIKSRYVFSWQANRPSTLSSVSLRTRPRARVDWVFVWDGLVFLSRINRIETRTIIYQSISLFVSHYIGSIPLEHAPPRGNWVFILYILSSCSEGCFQPSGAWSEKIDRKW